MVIATTELKAVNTYRNRLKMSERTNNIAAKIAGPISESEARHGSRDALSARIAAFSCGAASPR
jgi:hypothetical protein